MHTLKVHCICINYAQRVSIEHNIIVIDIKYRGLWLCSWFLQAEVAHHILSY